MPTRNKTGRRTLKLCPSASGAATDYADNIYELKITLVGTDPPVWRTVRVPGGVTLGTLHAVIQIAMGWEDDHLHEFRTKDRQRIGPADFDSGWDPHDGTVDESDVRLSDLFKRKRAKFTYMYDFGDNWTHELEVTDIAPPQPGQSYPACVAGERACPPEDCGGVWGYEEILSALAYPDDEQYAERLEWLGDGYDPEKLDLQAVNKHLRALR